MYLTTTSSSGTTCEAVENKEMGHAQNSFSTKKLLMASLHSPEEDDSNDYLGIFYLILTQIHVPVIMIIDFSDYNQYFHNNKLVGVIWVTYRELSPNSMKRFSSFQLTALLFWFTLIALLSVILGHSRQLFSAKKQQLTQSTYLALNGRKTKLATR